MFSIFYFLVLAISFSSISSARSHSQRSYHHKNHKSSNSSTSTNLTTTVANASVSSISSLANGNVVVVVSNSTSTSSNSGSNRIVGTVQAVGNSTVYNVTLSNGLSLEIIKEGETTVEFGNMTIVDTNNGNPGTTTTTATFNTQISGSSATTTSTRKHKGTLTSAPSSSSTKSSKGSSTSTSSSSASSSSSTGVSSSSSDLFQQYRSGANSYYLYALDTDERTAVLDAMQDAGMKTIRIFITGIDADNKGSSNPAIPDLEQDSVGTYDDTILEAIDDLMVDVYSRGMKLVIAMHDRYALGFWEVDAYATKFAIVSDGSSGSPQEADASTFYTDSTAISDFDNRLTHILNHQNAQMDNKAWSELSEVIYSFQPENEPMGHMDLVNDQWVCDRCGTIKSLTDIYCSTGGGIDLELSVASWAYSCSNIDIISVHDYGTDASSTVSSLASAKSQAEDQGMELYFEEFGFLGSDKADLVSQYVSALKENGVAWSIWEVTDPGAGSADYEIFTDEDAWQSILDASGSSSKKRSTQIKIEKPKKLARSSSLTNSSSSELKEARNVRRSAKGSKRSLAALKLEARMISP